MARAEAAHPGPESLGTDAAAQESGLLSCALAGSGHAEIDGGDDASLCGIFCSGAAGFPDAESVARGF